MAYKIGAKVVTIRRTVDPTKTETQSRRIFLFHLYMYSLSTND